MSDKKRFPETLESPPTSSEGLTTACQYCVVGCGYEAHLWEDGLETLPELTQANWVSPAMTGKVNFNGAPKIAAVVPDPKCSMNRGNHSVRGGTQGRDLVFSETNPADERDSTRERITTPYIRTKNGYEVVTTDEALKILVALIKEATGHQEDNGAVKFTNPQGLGVKLYEYQYLENTFAATSLLFQLIGTPNVAFHDRPSVASNTNGFDDSGIDPHGYAYEDIWDSDVLFLVGNNPYEAHSVFFMNYMTGKRLIVLDPRRTITADYAVKTNGLHLQPKVLGADTLVLNALARYIRDQQIAKPDEWRNLTPTDSIIEDADLLKIKQEAANTLPEFGPEKRRRARYQLSLEKYYEFLDEKNDDGSFLYSLENASKISGIDVDDLKKCAEILAGPVDDMSDHPKDRKVSLIFEKGLIWGYNYQNTAAMANLGLLLGSVLQRNGDNEGINRHGVTGRAGGHQKGWAEVRYRLSTDSPTSPKRGYPFHNATDEFISDDGSGDRFRINHYFDAHLVGTKIAPPHKRAKTISDKPDINLFWIIGCNPVGQIGNAEAKWKEIRRRQGDELPENVAEAKDLFLRKIKEGKLVIVQQDIYPNPTTQYADLILPAAGWGEHDFTRYTGERRLRLYSKFQDPPAHRIDGQLENVSRCLADWEIFSRIMLALMPDGAEVNGLKKTAIENWTESKNVFKDMALGSNRSGLFGTLESAGSRGGHEELRQRKTKGFIVPVKFNPTAPNESVQFKRTAVKLLDFKDNTTKTYAFMRADWKEIREDFEANLPQQEDEFIICNGRVNELWNSMFTNIRNETIRQRYPDDMPGTILEFNPADAEKLGVTNGDVVEVSGNQIHLGADAASFKGVVSVQEGGSSPFVPVGMVFAIFSYPAAMKRQMNEFPYREFTAQGYVNNITTGYVDPINPIAAVKYARGKIVNTGERYEIGTYLGPSYAPRNRAFAKTMIDDESKRLEWKMRELIVQKGLARYRLHKQLEDWGFFDKFADFILEPELLIEKFHKEPQFRKRFIQKIGSMNDSDLRDSWNDKETDLAKKWDESIPQT